MSYKLGFDVGISSVGWAVLNHDNEIVEAGVRLFPEGLSKNNEKRRDSRHLRRIIRRRHHRLERGDRLLRRYGLISSINDYMCEDGKTPYHIRVKGLSEELSDKELAIALRHLLKRRGIQSLSIADAEDGNKNTLSTKEILARTRNALDNGSYICELQLDRLEEKGKVRGTENRFFSSDYENEARTLLSLQRLYNEKVTDEFIEEYIRLLTTRRNYSEGPGNHTGDTPYGWKDEKEWMEKLRGKCAYTGELRIVKVAPTAELFNLLNDLNNMKIDGRHLTLDDKTLLIKKQFLQVEKSPSVKKILKVLGKDADCEVTGCRINEKGNEIFTEMKGFHALKKAYEKACVVFDHKNFDLLDEIATVLSTYQTVESVIPPLESLGLEEVLVEELANILNKKNHPFKGTHSLSKKAIMAIIEDLYLTDKNQMQLFVEKNMSIIAKYSDKGKHIEPDIVNNMYTSSVVRRAVGQTFKVFNTLLDKYKNFDYVTIEMAREKNSKERKDFIIKAQQKNRKLNETVSEILADRGRTGGKLFEKIKLYLLQDGKCIYTQEPIDLDKLISNPHAYVVDHIIPISISFDDSLSNKVLTTTKVSQEKGQRTPYQYLSKEQFEKMKAYINVLFEMSNDKTDNFNGVRMTRAKKQNLLLTEDITKWEVQEGFINRNLVDSRYACKEVASIFKSYFKMQKKATVVKNINGSFTQYLRKRMGIKASDRDEEGYKQYAVNACVIASVPTTLSLIKTIKRYDANEETGQVYDVETGEIIDDKELENAVKYFLSYGHRFEEYKGYKYSHKVDKKKNRCLSNETLYSTRFSDGEEYKVGKIRNIYADDSAVNQKIRRFFGDEEECTKLLIFKHDKASYDILKDIYDEYCALDTKKNPFFLYEQENGHKIRKYSKKGNGPEIVSLKYLDSVIHGTPLDISEKQGVKRNKRVILEGLTTYRFDIYYDGTEYKVMPIRYSDMSKGKIMPEKVDLYKNDAQITDDYHLHCSIYKNDIISINGEMYKVLGGIKNKLEVDTVTKRTSNEKRQYVSIGKKTKTFEKMEAGILGISVT